MLAFIISPKRQTLLELSSTYLRGSPSNKHKPQKKKSAVVGVMDVNWKARKRSKARKDKKTGDRLTLSIVSRVLALHLSLIHI